MKITIREYKENEYVSLYIEKEKGMYNNIFETYVFTEEDKSKNLSKDEMITLAFKRPHQSWCSDRRF